MRPRRTRSSTRSKSGFHQISRFLKSQDQSFRLAFRQLSIDGVPGTVQFIVATMASWVARRSVRRLATSCRLALSDCELLSEGSKKRLQVLPGLALALQSLQIPFYFGRRCRKPPIALLEAFLQIGNPLAMQQADRCCGDTENAYAQDDQNRPSIEDDVPIPQQARNQEIDSHG
jgi:hypothetical protein